MPHGATIVHEWGGLVDALVFDRSCYRSADSGSRTARKGAQRLDVGAPPPGPLRLARVLVRIDQSMPELLEPVRADEVDEIAGLELETEAPAVLAIQLVTARLP